ncbi:hypothetical protein ACIKK6_33230, partial [Bacillus thuringiensis]|uniref:hypothetical protein n=1 Tax=Bacillus thuringiensis TaxID=1428 RepID=UPI0037CDB7C3
MVSRIQRIRTELLPAGQTKKFSTWAMIPAEEVLIAFKMAHSTYTLDPYEFVSRGLKGGIWYPGYN